MIPILKTIAARIEHSTRLERSFKILPVDSKATADVIRGGNVLKKNGKLKPMPGASKDPGFTVEFRKTPAGQEYYYFEEGDKGKCVGCVFVLDDDPHIADELKDVVKSGSKIAFAGMGFDTSKAKYEMALPLWGTLMKKYVLVSEGHSKVELPFWDGMGAKPGFELRHVVLQTGEVLPKATAKTIKILAKTDRFV